MKKVISLFIVVMTLLQVSWGEMRGVSHPDLAHSLYMLHCQGCHLPTGDGYPDRVPKFTHSVGRFMFLEDGRAYLIQVPGASTSPLSDDELAQVLNWILYTFSRKELPRDFRPYTEKEISQYRYRQSGDIIEKRIELLKAIEQVK